MITADLELLEFPELLALVGRYAQTAAGRRRVSGLRPHTDRSVLETGLRRAEEACAYLRALGTPGKSAGLLRLDFGGIGDLEPVLAKLRVEGAELDPQEISALLVLLDRAGDFKHILAGLRDRFPALAELAVGIGEFRGLLRELSGKILPDGSLDDHASLELWRLRREIEKQRKAVQESLEAFLRQHAEEGTLQENLITIRSERFVVPVKAGARRRIDGVVHGVSSTGQTLFVEPLQTIELNNEMVALTEQEQREVHRILREMSDRLRQVGGGLQMALEVVSELDLAFATGRFAVDFGCVTPRFNSEQRLLLRDARHPLLEDVMRRRVRAPETASAERRAPRRAEAGAQGALAARFVVPLSLEMDRHNQVVVITGPNAGGKTVALKTIGLLALAAQSGIPTPAAEADLPLLDQVLADIGDYQSIQENLSTFSAHLTHIERMVEQVTPGSLVLLDELGAATDPQEGGALGVAIVEHFLKTGALVLASTHHLALKAYATNTPGVLNASVGFDEKTLQPTYKLIVGVPGKSSGLAIAQRLGLKPEIVARARQALSAQDEEVSRLLEELHKSTEEAERLRGEVAARERELRERTAQLAAEWEKREKKRLAELEARVQALIAEFEKRVQGEMQQIQDKRLQKEAERRMARTRRAIREEFDTAVVEQLGGGEEEAPAPRPVYSVREGDTVRVKALGRNGIVRRRVDFANLEVEVGSMKMRVSLDQVELIENAPAPPASLPANVTVHTAPRGGEPLTEINVIGCTAEEARERVDKFLDSAALAALPRVRVVHGHGMGILRKALHELFSGHPLVDKFYAAPPSEGGTGATIVELRV
jgi:DNA mismatch repair protein MutS2